MSEKRDAYVRKLKAKLDEWNADIDKLQAKKEQASAEAEIEMQKKIEELKAQRADVQQKLDDLSRAGSGAWEDLKTGVDLAWETLGESIKSARSRFQ